MSMGNTDGNSREETGRPDFKITTESLLDLIKASPLGIAAVDLDGNIRLWNEAAERNSGWSKDEVIGQSIKILSSDSWEAYEELRQRTLKREVFTSLPMSVTRKDGSKNTISYSTAPILDVENHVVGTMAVLYDITEKIRMETALKDSLEKMSRVLNETVEALASAVESRDPYTASHQRRVASLACGIAGEMGSMSVEQVQGIRTAAVLHDIGKLYVPFELLNKPGDLKDIELALIKSHPQAGYDILENIEFPWPVARIVQQHHERVDGSGYPAGLQGEKILMEARIIGVADVVEAMSSHRPYRPSKGIEAALEEINKGRGSLYDPQVVDACLDLCRKGSL